MSEQDASAAGMVGADVREAIRVLAEREAARAAKKQWAKKTYADVVSGLYRGTGGVEAMLEAVDELGLGLAELKFDANVSTAIREMEVQLAAAEEQVAGFDAQIEAADRELAGMKLNDRRAGAVMARRKEAQGLRDNLQMQAGVVQSSMRACAERSVRVFGGEFRMLAADVRARALQEAAVGPIEPPAEEEAATDLLAEPEIVAAVPGMAEA